MEVGTIRDGGGNNSLDLDTHPHIYIAMLHFVAPTTNPTTGWVFKVQ